MPGEYQAGEQLHIGIMIFPNVEDLDFVGPLETLKNAAYHEAMQRGADDLAWEVFTVAATADHVATSSGMHVQPQYTFADHPAIDVLVVPGGDTRQAQNDPATLAWLRAVTANTQLTTSVCTGAFLLATIGLLDGRRATTHWSALDRLEERFPQIQVQRDTRWVDEGDIITAAGISAGIDMSLHVVDRLLGRPMAEEIAHVMEYSWDDRGK